MHQILKELKLFRDFNNQELEEIDKICQKISFNKGDLIFEAKTEASNLFIISEGAVDLQFEVSYYNSTQNITLDRKSKGELFGWSALTKSNTYTLSAQALENSTLLSINQKDIDDLCNSNYRIGYILMKNISETIGERFELLQNMLISEVQQNLKVKEI